MCNTDLNLPKNQKLNSKGEAEREAEAEAPVKAKRAALGKLAARQSLGKAAECSSRKNNVGGWSCTPWSALGSSQIGAELSE